MSSYTLTSSINHVIEKLNNNKRVIIPTESVYLQVISLIDIDNFKKLKLLSSYTLYCLNKNDFLQYVNTDKYTEIELSLIDKLLDLNKPLTLNLYSKNLCINDEKINISISLSKTMNSIMHGIGFPLIGFNCNINTTQKNPFYFTNINHVMDKYYSCDILIFNKSIETEKTIENSIYEINNNKVKMIHSGSSLPKFVNIEDNYFQEYKLPKNLLKDKKFFKLVICELNNDIIPEKYSNELINSINTYINQVAIIDFNSYLIKIKDKANSYVDLSESGDINEALFNFYNVIYQVSELDINIIMIYNFELLISDVNSLLWSKINTMINDTIYIPYLL